MPGIAIKPAVLKELQRQLNHELSAAHAYEALALWCEDQNFKGFARFFLKQAAEERVHARKFMDHLLDRGILPALEALAAPRMRFESLLDIARQAQSMEQANTAGVNACFEAAMRENDFPAQVLLHWFITEQVEEEDWTDEMIDRVERASCAGGVAELDRHIERYLSEEPGDAEK
jgi:ferritin